MKNAIRPQTQILYIIASISLCLWALIPGIGRPAMSLALLATLVLAVLAVISTQRAPGAHKLPLWFILTCGAVMQYFVFFAAVAYLRPPPVSTDFIQAADRPQFWLIGAGLFLLLLTAWSRIRLPTPYYRRALAIALCIVVVIMFASRIPPVGGYSCRITGPSGNYFFPAYALGIMSILSLSPTFKVPLTAQALLVTAAVVTMTFISGTRMIFIAYVIMFLAAIFIQLLAKRVTVKWVMILFATFIGSIALGLLLDIATQCSLAARLGVLFSDAKSSIDPDASTTALSHSVNARAELLQAGWEFAKQSLWAGYGIHEIYWL